MLIPPPFRKKLLLIYLAPVHKKTGLRFFPRGPVFYFIKSKKSNYFFAE